MNKLKNKKTKNKKTNNKKAKHKKTIRKSKYELYKQLILLYIKKDS